MTDWAGLAACGSGRLRADTTATSARQALWAAIGSTKYALCCAAVRAKSGELVGADRGALLDEQTAAQGLHRGVWSGDPHETASQDLEALVVPRAQRTW